MATACLVDNNYFYTIPVDSISCHHQSGCICAHLFNRVLQIAHSDAHPGSLEFALFILNAVSLFKFIH